MDVNETLLRLRELSRMFLSEEGDFDTDDVVEMAESFQALDEWLLKQGFLPRDWQRKG